MQDNRRFVGHPQTKNGIHGGGTTVKDMDSKSREKALRRVALRQGFCLIKSRKRNPFSPGYGGYRLVDPWQNAVVSGDSWLSIDELEAWLLAEKRQTTLPWFS